MKIFLGLFVVTSILSSLALADGGMRVATVNSFDVSKNWKDLSGLSTGSVKVDYLKKEVTLTLTHSDSSLDDVVVVLPVVGSSLNACNIETIKAFRDRTPVDGPKETITIEDPTYSTCEKQGASSPTHITYEEVGGWTMNVYRAQFGATALK